MHLEIRELNGRKKYYLSHSLRKGSKVQKIRIYLGTDLSAAELQEKRKKAEQNLKERIKAGKIIRDPYQFILSSSELKELKMLNSRGELHIKHLSENDWITFTESFVYDTNAIEGSHIEAREVKEILEQGKRPAHRSEEDIAETIGLAEAVKYIRDTKEHISSQFIEKLHHIVFRNSKPFAGKFRERGIEVVVADGFGRILHRGAPSYEVESLLEKLVGWYLKNREKYPPLVLAAVVHNQFENIHPFQDGNGRVGRLLLNNILIKNGLPPLNIELKHRMEYYGALQAYQNGNDLRHMLELMLKEYRELKNKLKKR